MYENKVCLSVSDLPTQWYNIIPDLPEPVPEPLNGEGKIPRVEMLKSIRPTSLNEQDETREKWIDIPDEVLEKLIQIGRPTPLQRAINLERYLDTPAKIYFKREDLLPTGSFKLNTAIAQAYYAKKEGYHSMITETGAGQWGMALTLAAKIVDIDCHVYMARVSARQKQYRRMFMEFLGGKVYESPSNRTVTGRDFIKDDPEHPGSLSIGISEAIETALANKGEYAYASGSNLQHVLLHQTIIGLETIKQLEKISENPDQLVACVGGGSNLGGFMFPFLPEKLKNQRINFLAAESKSIPRLTEGEYKYDYGDSSGLTPMIKSYTLGKEFVPPPIHTGGLRQHNGSPLIGILRANDLLDAKAYSQKNVFEAGRLFIQTEGIIPAPETCHAIAAVIEAAIEAKKENQKKNIVFCFSGLGHLDLEGYEAVLYS